MSYDLIGEQVGLAFTPESGGANIKIAEGVVVSFNKEDEPHDVRPWATNWPVYASFGHRWQLRLRCTVNSGTGASDGNPQMPKGIPGSLTLYKRGASTTTGKWVGRALPFRMVLSANAQRYDEQTVDWTILGSGGITETL